MFGVVCVFVHGGVCACVPGGVRACLPACLPTAAGKDSGEHAEADPRSVLRHPACVVSSPCDGRLFVLDLEVDGGPGRIVVYKYVEASCGTVLLLAKSFASSPCLRDAWCRVVRVSVDAGV